MSQNTRIQFFRWHNIKLVLKMTNALFFAFFVAKKNGSRRKSKKRRNQPHFFKRTSTQQTQMFLELDPWELHFQNI